MGFSNFCKTNYIRFFFETDQGPQSFYFQSVSDFSLARQRQFESRRDRLAITSAANTSRPCRILWLADDLFFLTNEFEIQDDLNLPTYKGPSRVHHWYQYLHSRIDEVHTRFANLVLDEIY